ncbi:hypothetical protein NQ318_006848 [Aromia moschata]|uniref:Uncharacterized protein n=1 Tax=Aromia moschata TaxID=1265417 RepID=A0AAV8YLB8_9CUCU|nr:hypothetical protein NQ318_006848 [Aromia moschata]
MKTLDEDALFGCNARPTERVKQSRVHRVLPGGDGGGAETTLLFTGGYSGTNPAPTSWQPVSRGSKRPLSESDCDDVYSEESSKEQCTSPGDADSCQMLSRKKRRGVIEKKRRDRINMSLSELKRLVPSAFEKQGSAKLEKAEILQMTVDHLKMLHSKGLDSFAYDPHKYAMDYHGMGFRECVAEVARYLERIEGLDVQNPLRLRLTSHLQCCAAQRELASKQATGAPWGYGTSQPPYPPLNALPTIAGV